MKEKTRENIASMNIMIKGREGSFDPLGRVPFNTSVWYNHIREILEEELDFDKYEDDTVIAEASIDRVSYTDPETGECDIRWEARYGVVV